MTIGFLGDSITLGYALQSPEQDRFSHLIAEKFHYTEMNFGITGTLVARAGLSRYDGTAYVDRIEQLRGVDFAVIFGGTNDYFWTDCELSPPDSTNPDEQYFTNAIRSIITQARSFLPDHRILVVTPYPHHGVGNFYGASNSRESNEHDTTAANFVGQTLDDYCEALMQICSQKHVQVLDLRKAPDPFVWQIMTVDGCHPNPAGHRWLAHYIGEKVSAMARVTKFNGLE